MCRKKYHCLKITWDVASGQLDSDLCIEDQLQENTGNQSLCLQGTSPCRMGQVCQSEIKVKTF